MPEGNSSSFCQVGGVYGSVFPWSGPKKGKSKMTKLD
uniref:Uncharacterized protein n=1 Tax=Nelumbo nucifera TaxID=4432 RepID=A0A822Y6D6_NELNU|nr:TPA_asm: hypothetical protein HUJ06_028063 [Nelumbo nucifera]